MQEDSKEDWIVRDKTKIASGLFIERGINQILFWKEEVKRGERKKERYPKTKGLNDITLIFNVLCALHAAVPNSVATTLVFYWTINFFW